MKGLYKIASAVLALLAAVSCSGEFGPVFTGKYDEPGSGKVWTMEDFSDCKFVTIKELKNMYVDDEPIKFTENYAIKGQVTTSDQAGNFYRSFYIQDETAGIEIKVGKTGLYNDYKLGQWIYVRCKDLVLGSYEGAKQLGWEDLTGDYESAYMDVQLIVEQHVFRGKLDTPVEPVEVLEEKDLKSADYQGKYVTVKDMSYTNTMFCMLNINPDKDKKKQENRIFLDEDTAGAWGVTTWAMSKQKFSEYLNSGVWDNAEVADGSARVSEIKALIKPAAYSVSQYFKKGKTTMAIRTSGYSKFADKEMKETIGDGTKVTFTGILTVYKNEPQFTLISLDGVKDENATE